MLTIGMLLQAGGYITSIAHICLWNVYSGANFQRIALYWMAGSLIKWGWWVNFCWFCDEITEAYSVKHLAGTCGIPALSLDPTRLPVCSWRCGEQLGSRAKDLRLRTDCCAFQCFSSGVSMLGDESWDLEEPIAFTRWFIFSYIPYKEDFNELSEYKIIFWCKLIAVISVFLHFYSLGTRCIPSSCI